MISIRVALTWPGLATLVLMYVIAAGALLVGIRPRSWKGPAPIAPLTTAC